MQKNHEVTAIIALGANLNQPAQQVRQAIAALNEQTAIEVMLASPLYCTRPVGYTDQSDFINAVVMVKTTLLPLALLDSIHNIENCFGRIRTFRNAPRTLDLDIIDYDHQLMHSAALQLPHPRAHERAFVMVPLAAIAADYCIGTSALSAAQWAKQLMQDDPTQIITQLDDIH